MCAVVTASATVWQPAVFGSSGTAWRFSSSKKPASAVPPVIWRRSATVTMPGRDAAIESDSDCSDG
ncbi:hypothetical protein FEQ05_05772 [Burkholderia pseudomultivorans]|nr:hypothetical protein [Burkholderia pseudomultivorans]